MATKSNSSHISRQVALLRIVFGVMWAVDALFKWQPSFAASFVDQVNGAAAGQPSWLMPWFHFWSRLLSTNPHLFAILTASAESAIAIALLLGIARRSSYLAAVIFSLLIWSVAEGFGGPYGSGSTDIGTGIIYAVVFLALYGLERLAKPSSWAVDNYLNKRFKWWSKLSEPAPAKS